MSKALGNIVGPTEKSHLVTTRYILHPVTSISSLPLEPCSHYLAIKTSIPLQSRTLLGTRALILTTPKQKENAH